jgi:hypothetical protein
MVVAEKRYVVAGKIVETFLDPAFNKTLRDGFTWDTLTKRELANTLMTRLPPDVLDRFAQAYREPSSEAFLSSPRRANARNPSIQNSESSSQ